MAEANHDVVLFAGALGDLLLALPALRLLARRDGPFVLAVRRPLEALAAAAGCARRVTALDDREMAAFLGGGAAPSWWPHRPRVTAWFGAADAGLRARLAAAARDVRWLRVERGPGAEHAALAYASAVGAPIDWPTAVALGRVDARPVAADPPLLVVHAGAGAHAKRWHAAGHGAVVRWWRSRGGAVAELRGDAEQEEALPPLPGAEPIEGRPVLDVAGTLARARAYVGHDTGPSHLAGCVGVPGVVLFGPTDPARWRPLGDGLRVLRAPAAACTPEGFDAPPAATVIALLDALQP